MDAAGESGTDIRDVLLATLDMDTLVLADQKRHINQLYADTGCYLKDLPRAMVGRDGWQKIEREKVKRTPSYQYDLIIYIYIYRFLCLMVYQLSWVI